MTFKSLTLIAGSTLALLATSAVWAQASAPAGTDKPATSQEMMEAFTKADANKDEKLDKVEAAGVPGLVASFEKVDADADKFVSKAELEKALKP
jgi:hypothetical protein